MGGVRLGYTEDGQPGVVITDEDGADTVTPFKHVGEFSHFIHVLTEGLDGGKHISLYYADLNNIENSLLKTVSGAEYASDKSLSLETPIGTLKGVANTNSVYEVYFTPSINCTADVLDGTTYEQVSMVAGTEYTGYPEFSVSDTENKCSVYFFIH